MFDFWWIYLVQRTIWQKSKVANNINRTIGYSRVWKSRPDKPYSSLSTHPPLLRERGRCQKIGKKFPLRQIAWIFFLSPSLSPSTCQPPPLSPRKYGRAPCMHTMYYTTSTKYIYRYGRTWWVKHILTWDCCSFKNISVGQSWFES